MIKLENFLKPTQSELFCLLCKKYRGDAVVRIGNYILIPGGAPIMLIAHLDTVHKEPVKHICKSANGNILMSPQGIGGDDRCGVYALVKAYEASDVKPWLLFTCDEEIGGIGAERFIIDYSEGKLPKHSKRLSKGLSELKLLIEIDRKGYKDAVFYDCDNPEFEKYITGKGFVTANGTFSDISIIAPKLGVAAVNLSSGYYNAHMLHEFINRKQLEAVIQGVIGIIADTVNSDFPKYKYIERIRKFGNTLSKAFNSWKFLDNSSVSVPNDLPAELKGPYTDLLDIYSEHDLEEIRNKYGNCAIASMYEEEFGMFFDIDDAVKNDNNLLY